MDPRATDNGPATHPGHAAQEQAHGTQLDRALAVLRFLEWSLETWAPGGMCPVCFEPRANGHAPTCGLSAALTPDGEG